MDIDGTKIPNGGPPIVFKYFWPYMWENKISPMKTCRICGVSVTKKFLHKYSQEKLKLEGEHLEAMAKYALNICMVEGTTETVLFDLFEPGLFPHIPIMDKLDKVEVSFAFGDRDWVDSSGAEYLISQK